MLIILMGALSITRMIVDIFPVIDIPVVLVVWNYNGLTTEDMERRVVFISERAYSTTVNGISRIESQSIPSIGMLKVYFQPGTDIGGAIAQISSVEQLHPAHRAARHAAAGRDPVQRLERARRADDAVEQDADRAADLRLQPELHPHSALHHSRSVHAWPVRRQVSGRSMSISTSRDCRRKASRRSTSSTRCRHPTSSFLPAQRGSATANYNVQLNSSPSTVDRFNALPHRRVQWRACHVGRRGARERQLRARRPTSCT